jgi:hypothetical protein
VRVIAVDWSGRTANPGAAIWLAEARDGKVARLEGGRDRAELVDHLIEEAGRDPKLLAGLDFAFSFPDSFVRRHAVSAFEFWNVVAAQGEAWLRMCRPPFWRAAGVPALAPEDAYRRTELEVGVSALHPTSVFKLVGASQVGPGAIRGMPQLTRLREAGFAVWPFEDATLPSVIEIWPRALTGPIVKTRRADRAAYLRRHVPELREPLAGVAASNDDVFDATVSAAVMSRHRGELAHLSAEPEYALEGRIWTS